LAWIFSLWWRSFSEIASASPRTIATSPAGKSRPGAGKRASVPRSNAPSGRERDRQIGLVRNRAHRGRRHLPELFDRPILVARRHR
jgi:hypothetical protein